jgi:16S rRNA (cytidine1402-2'-O)-methyltransferase
MPSTLPTNNSDNRLPTGRLYIVATPIGNKNDITLRALNILRSVDVIAAEDTRKTRRFLAQHDIEGRFVSYHEHNEKEKSPKLIEQLIKGASIALVSNAGTPTLSDPGYRLIESALANDLPITPIPGVSAAIAALSVSGLPTDSFTFIGFMPKKKGKRLTLLSDLAAESRTLIFYESPKRVVMLLEEMLAVLGNRSAVLAREMTKLHEEFLRGRLTEIAENLKKRPEIKGECTLLVAGSQKTVCVDWDSVRSEIQLALKSKKESISQLAKTTAMKYGLSKNKIYDEALKIQKQITDKS